MKTSMTIAAVVTALALSGCGNGDQNMTEQPEIQPTASEGAASPMSEETSTSTPEPTETDYQNRFRPGPTSPPTSRADGGSGDITTPFRNNANTQDVIQFVDRVEMSSAGVVSVYTNLERVSATDGEQAMAKNAMAVCDAAVSTVRGEEYTPEPISVLDADGEVLATNVTDGQPGEECTYVSQ